MTARFYYGQHNCNPSTLPWKSQKTNTSLILMIACDKLKLADQYCWFKYCLELKVCIGNTAFSSFCNPKHVNQANSGWREDILLKCIYFEIVRKKFTLPFFAITYSISFQIAFFFFCSKYYLGISMTFLWKDWGIIFIYLLKYYPPSYLYTMVQFWMFYYKSQTVEVGRRLKSQELHWNWKITEFISNVFTD